MVTNSRVLQAVSTLGHYLGIGSLFQQAHFEIATSNTAEQTPNMARAGRRFVRRYSR